MAFAKQVEKLCDLILVKRIKRNYKSDSALRELSGRHRKLYLSLIRNTLAKNISEKRDLEDDYLLFVYKAAKKFNLNKKIKFSSYLGLVIKWKCLNLDAFNVKYPKNNLDNLKESHIIEHSQRILYDPIVLKTFIEYINLKKDKRIKKLFKLRYFRNKRKPMIWDKVGKELHLSAQGCINIHNQIIKEFTNKQK